MYNKFLLVLELSFLMEPLKVKNWFVPNMYYIIAQKRNAKSFLGTNSTYAEGIERPYFLVSARTREGMQKCFKYSKHSCNVCWSGQMYCSIFILDFLCNFSAPTWRSYMFFGLGLVWFVFNISLNPRLHRLFSVRSRCWNLLGIMQSKE